MSAAKRKPDVAEPRPGDEDARLMLEFQAGRREAFDELVERNVGAVHALVFRFLREPSQLEDITQEVFLRIFRNARTYQPTAKFSTWLYRIVANLCFNVMRSRRKRRLVSLDAPRDRDEDQRHDLPDERSAEPDEGLRESEQARQVADALDRLPENQKVAIILNKYEGKDYAEISEIMDLSTMAIKSLLSRARTNLKEHLRRVIEE